MCCFRFIMWYIIVPSFCYLLFFSLKKQNEIRSEIRLFFFSSSSSSSKCYFTVEQPRANICIMLFVRCVLWLVFEKLVQEWGSDEISQGEHRNLLFFFFWRWNNHRGWFYVWMPVKCDSSQFCTCLFQMLI